MDGFGIGWFASVGWLMLTVQLGNYAEKYNCKRQVEATMIFLFVAIGFAAILLF